MVVLLGRVENCLSPGTTIQPPRNRHGLLPAPGSGIIACMAGDPSASADRFRPLRPARGWRLVAAFTIGPLAWLIALDVAAILLDHTEAIEFGLLVALASFAVSMILLALLRAGRRREERRYAARG
jgi:hypothetical protein